MNPDSSNGDWNTVTVTNQRLLSVDMMLHHPNAQRRVAPETQTQECFATPLVVINLALHE